MPTIRIEYEVPEDDCRNCDFSDIVAPPAGLACGMFYRILKEDNYKFKRCQPCIDAEVKEGE